MKQNINIKLAVYKIFYGIFLFVFALVFCKVLFGDSIHSNNTIFLLAALLFWLMLLLGVRFLFTKYHDTIEKHYNFILGGFLLAYGMLLLINGFLLRFTPAFDMDAIYGGAIQWVKEGTFSNYYEYYGYFPNNLGAMTILHFFFKIASIIGIKDFFAIGIILNCLLLLTTIFITSQTCRKLQGSAAGMSALAFFACCLPFLFMGAAFYTDSLSLLFPVLFYYLYLHYKEQDTVKKRFIFAASMAVVLTLGMTVKFTVLIAFIAVIIDALLSMKWKNICIFAVCCILTASAAFGILNTYMYHVHLDRENCTQLHTPYLHWVMMGMQNNGSYNAEDYEYTRSFLPDERNEACLERIRERIHDLGPGGITELFMNKLLVCFGDGTFAVSDFLDDSPRHERWMHRFILYDGEQFPWYRHLTTGMLLVIYFFMVKGAADCLKEKEITRKITNLAPKLACLGILSFLMFWETSGRYFTNFIPLMIVCSVTAFTEIGKKKKVSSDN